MEPATDQWSSQDREAMARFIGESPATVHAIHALRSGLGRAWVSGTPDDPRALIVEHRCLPGEPMGFGDDTELLDLLACVVGWDCFELTSPTADRLGEEFARRWGRAKRVTDVVHALDGAASVKPHRHVVQPLRISELNRLRVVVDDLLPDRDLLEPAVALGRVVVAIDGELVVGQASSFAAGERYADVGVQVAETHREHGLATACAAMVCEAVRAAGLTPVWSCAADNRASMRVAAKLGFVEVTRLVYLVRRHRTS